MILEQKKKHPSSIAVLLAAYNGMAWIEEQVDSIFKQIEVDIDIYISVDMSSDGTYEWCNELAKNNVCVQTLPYGDHFGGAAKNFFRLIRDVDFHNYDYIALADQDDIWMPNKLFHAVNILQKYNMDAYSSDVIAFWNDGREKLVRKSYPQKEYDYFFEAAGPGCSYVMKHQSLQQFKKFLTENWDESNALKYHDWLMYAYFRYHRLSWHIDSSPLVRYRQHSSNQVGSNFGLGAYIKRYLLVRNNWYRKEVDKIRTLLGCEVSLDLWFRITNFSQLRRRPRDAILLLVMTLTGVY